MNLEKRILIFVDTDYLSHMRQLLKVWALSTLTVIPLLLSGCTDMAKTELDETHAKLKALQELAASVNNDLTTLNEIIAILDDSHTIDPASLVQTDDGYEVSFRDGKKIYLHFGVDGVDGETLIPIGVKNDEDGLYYWTVNGDFLRNADSTLMRAGATDGKNGNIPKTMIDEKGVWRLSMDNWETYIEIGTVEEMDGVGVFSGIDLSDPTKVALTLMNGTVLEIPCQTSFKMSFDGPVQDTELIAGGESLSIPYEIVKEGDSGQPVVVTSGTDGTYLSWIEAGPSPEKGVVHVQAPEEFSEGYILLTATCGGYSAIKMMSFQERTVTPAKSMIVVRLGNGESTSAVEYGTNFDYTVSQPDGDWLQAVSDPSAGSITFTATPNTGNTVRTCTVTVSPKDNPDYACTTFLVLQATKQLTFDIDPECPFAFDSGSKTLDIPAEGGDADIWITYENDPEKGLEATVPEGAEWASAELSAVDGFYRLRIHADANESGESRKAKIQITYNEAIMGEITIKQR